MKVTLERLPESRIQLDIEVEPERLERSLDAAYKRVAARTRIPGFRPGKAPRNVVERMVGREGLIREALDKLVPDIYNEAIEAEDIDAIDQPQLEIVELEPVRFKATVPVRPTVSIDGYLDIRVEKETPEVTDEMVAEQIMLLRRRHATQAPVDRAAQWDDILIADVKGEAEGETFVQDEDAEFALREGQNLLVPGLAEAFVGMSKGEEKTVELEIPEDFQLERLQGKKATFTLNLKEVKEEQLPEEDDEFANMVNADEFPTLDALTERIRTDLETSLKEQAESKFRAEAVDKLVELAELEYPRVLVEHEIEHLVNENTGNDRDAYVAYLQQIGRTEAEFREQFREAAEARLRRSLVLSQLAEEEGIKVSNEDVESELDRLSAPLGEQADQFRQLFASQDGVSTIARNLLSQKTLDRLAAIAAGEAGDAPDGAATEEAAPADSVEAEPEAVAAEEDQA